ncbi:MAG: hypothetical protein O6831_00810, partial [Alphaproteobacteria bacterium]|nr:hypothetical protein [Alphaproteobacteria bacterium]
DSADAKPAGACDPWPGCNNGGDESGDGATFTENCKGLAQWTVIGTWSISKGECSAKNTDAEHFMVTATDIDLSGALEATLSYKYRIKNADFGEFMNISVSNDGGVTFTELRQYVGNESGNESLILADYVTLTNQVRLRASCFVSTNNEICGWDNIKVETVADPSGELLVTINSPQAKTYGSASFPLTFNVSLSHIGEASYSLNGGTPVPMTNGGETSGTVLADVKESLPDGKYTFQVFATDDLGNANEMQSVEFNVDNLAPSIEFVDPTPPDGSSQSSSDIAVILATNSASDHYSFVDFDNDLFLWMRMEEVVGDVVVDSSPYGNDGLAEGHAFQNPNGSFGSAFEFDGINHGGGTPTDRIVIPGFQDNHPIFNSSFTVMAWAKPDINEKMVIIGTKSITNLPGWHLRTSGGNHRLRMGVNTGYTTATAASAETPNPMEPNVWVHVVGIYDSAVPSIRLYLDGEFIDETTEGVSASGYGNDLELAIAVPEDPQKAWDGLVDEVLIFNRVLDANEIKAVYDSTANQFQKNYTGLGSGVHEFVGHSVNAAGNRDQTEVRSVTID